MRTRRPRSSPAPRSSFAGYRFPPDVIMLAVRWYLRFGLSYRDVEELLTERGVEVDHVNVYRWVQRFTPLLAEAARPCRHRVGTRWFADETYVKVAGRWRYVYRAIDQFGQVIDVFVSPRRDVTAAHRFFERAIGTTTVTPIEVVTDKAATYPVVLEALLPAAWHRTEQYANNRVEADHGRLKARLRPMRGLKQDRNTRIVIAGHAFIQNVRRGHYELAVEAPANRRVAGAPRHRRSPGGGAVRRLCPRAVHGRQPGIRVRRPPSALQRGSLTAATLPASACRPGRYEFRVKIGTAAPLHCRRRLFHHSREELSCLNED